MFTIIYVNSKSMGLEKHMFWIWMTIKLKTILKIEEFLIFLHWALVGISKANISDCYTGMYCCFVCCMIRRAVLLWYSVLY